MPSILVTGACGNVGQSVVRHLLQNGHHVVAADLEAPKAAAVAARWDDRVRLCWGNICDPSFWPRAVQGVDAVVHLAALIPPTANRLPELATAVNVTATVELVRHMQASAIAKRLVFASSMGVAGQDQHLRIPPLRSAEVPKPFDHYGRTKVEAEDHVRGSGLRWSILRLGVCPPITLSMKDANDFDNVFETSADGRMELVHNDDVGLAFANAVSCDEAIGKILLIGGGERCRSTALEFYNRMFEALGLRPLDPRVLRPGPTRFFGDWLDTAESQRLLRYQRHSLDDILQAWRAQLGPARWLMKLLAPLASRVIRRRSPHFARR